MNGRACAKFILCGEHSIVYRGRAVALPVRELELRLTENPDGLEGLRFNGNLLASDAFERIRSVRALIGAPDEHATEPLRGLDVISTIPVASGLGSSAALCVAFARARGFRAGRELAEAALRGEVHFHGRPSGVDPYTIALEKPLVFESGSRRERDLFIPRSIGAGFALASSGREHSTHDVLAAVQASRERSPAEFDTLIDDIALNTEALIEAWENSRLEDVGRRMDHAHELLGRLGVSTPDLEAACERLRAAGALGAKLTGSGCGGYVVGLFRGEQKESVQTSGGEGGIGGGGGGGTLPLVWTEIESGMGSLSS